jgi:hypothetical protein
VEDVYNSQVDIPIYEKLGCASNAEKMMCFLLNERTRELCGEMLRWEDLARTKSLNDRWHAFNDAMAMLGEYGKHGALDKVEGVVYRVERKGEVDFLAKYVRHDKADGIYLESVSGMPTVWNVGR